MPYEPDVEVVVDTVRTQRQFAYLDSDPRKVRGRVRSTFEPFSSEQGNAQYHDQVPFDGKHK